MRSFFQIKIKGRRFWYLCATLLMGIVITCCSIRDFSVDQPATAVVGSTVHIKMHLQFYNIFADRSENFVFGFLAPKGWAAAQNLKITYTSSASTGTGNLVLMSSTTTEPQSNGLTWAAALKKKFGIGGNLIDDMEWVVYQSDIGFPLSNGEHINGDFDLALKVGADGNNTLCKLGYVVAESYDGLKEPDGSLESGDKYEYYAQFISSCFQLTGGPGETVDFCNPQLASYDPPKALDNDFFTITYDGNVTTTPLNNAPAVYLCATGNTSDGKAITVCEQTAKTKLTLTAPGSNRYKITIWPRQFFGLTDSQTLTNMTYYVTDAAGTKKVGYGNTADPFVFTFKCK